jgi:hypothetical protein
MTETVPLLQHRAEAYAKAVAGEDRGPIAFVAVMPHEAPPGYNGALGVAIANERGYHPVPLGWARYTSFESAADHADFLNEEVLKNSDMESFRIIASTMGGLRYTRDVQ